MPSSTHDTDVFWCPQSTTHAQGKPAPNVAATWSCKTLLLQHTWKNQNRFDESHREIWICFIVDVFNCSSPMKLRMLKLTVEPVSYPTSAYPTPQSDRGVSCLNLNRVDIEPPFKSNVNLFLLLCFMKNLIFTRNNNWNKYNFMIKIKVNKITK